MLKKILEQIKLLEKLQSDYDNKKISQEEFLTKIDKDSKFVFLKEIIKRISEDIRYNNLPTVEKPIFKIITGQPGSGKSYIVNSDQSTNKDFLILDSDEYREYTPYAKILKNKEKSELLGINDLNYFKYTQSYSSVINTYFQIIGKRDKKNIIFQTMGGKHNQWLIDMLKDYQKIGYEITVSSISTNKHLSYLQKDERYLKEKIESGYGRWVSDKDHNNTISQDNGFQKLIKDISISDLEKISFLIYKYNEGIVFKGYKESSSPLSNISEIERVLELGVSLDIPIKELEDRINGINAKLKILKQEILSQQVATPKILDYLRKKIIKYNKYILLLKEESKQKQVLKKQKNYQEEILDSFEI